MAPTTEQRWRLVSGLGAAGARGSGGGGGGAGAGSAAAAAGGAGGVEAAAASDGARIARSILAEAAKARAEEAGGGEGSEDVPQCRYADLWDGTEACLAQAAQSKASTKELGEGLRQWSAAEQAFVKALPFSRRRFECPEGETGTLGVALGSFCGSFGRVGEARARLSSVVGAMGAQLLEFRRAQNNTKKALEVEAARLKKTLAVQEATFQRARAKYDKSCRDAELCIALKEKAHQDKQLHEVSRLWQRTTEALITVQESEQQYKAAVEELRLFRAQHSLLMRMLLEELQLLEESRVEYVKALLFGVTDAFAELQLQVANAVDDLRDKVAKTDSARDTKDFCLKHMRPPLDEIRFEKLVSPKIEAEIEILVGGGPRPICHTSSGGGGHGGAGSGTALQQYPQNQQQGHGDPNLEQRGSAGSAGSASAGSSAGSSAGLPRHDSPRSSVAAAAAAVARSGHLRSVSQSSAGQLEKGVPAAAAAAAAPAAVTAAAATAAVAAAAAAQPAGLKASVSAASPRPVFVRAQYDYTAAEASELSFRAGDVIQVLSEDPSGWWEGRLKNGEQGSFPENYTKGVTLSQALAYGFKPQMVGSSPAPSAPPLTQSTAASAATAQWQQLSTPQQSTMLTRRKSAASVQISTIAAPDVAVVVVDDDDEGNAVSFEGSGSGSCSSDSEQVNGGDDSPPTTSTCSQPAQPAQPTGPAQLVFSAPFKLAPPLAQAAARPRATAAVVLPPPPIPAQAAAAQPAQLLESKEPLDVVKPAQPAKAATAQPVAVAVAAQQPVAQSSTVVHQFGNQFRLPPPLSQPVRLKPTAVVPPPVPVPAPASTLAAGAAGAGAQAMHLKSAQPPGPGSGAVPTAGQALIDKLVQPPPVPMSAPAPAKSFSALAAQAALRSGAAVSSPPRTQAAAGLVKPSTLLVSSPVQVAFVPPPIALPSGKTARQESEPRQQDQQQRQQLLEATPVDERESKEESGLLNPVRAPSPRSTPSPRPAPVSKVVVLFDYAAQDPGDLTIKKREILDVHGIDKDGGWLDASDSAGNRGMIPATYVKFVSPAALSA